MNHLFGKSWLLPSYSLVLELAPEIQLSSLGVGLLVALISCPTPTCAQQWEYLGLSGRTITAIAVRSVDTIYASAHSDFPPIPGSVFRTTNAGATWDTVVFSGSVLDLKMNPRNPEVLYAGFGGSIYPPYGVLKTTDGGISWFHADSGIIADGERGVRIIEFDPVHPETLYVGTAGPAGGNLYKTTNAGLNWVPVGDGTLLQGGVTAIAVNPESTQIMYAGTISIGSLLKTNDGGLTWESTGLQDISVLDLIIDPVNPLLIYAGVEFPSGGAMRSTDGGVSWTVANLGLPGQTGLGDIAIHPTTRVIYAAVIGASDGGAFQSTDYGDTWLEMGGLPNGNSFNCVTLSPDHRDLYFGITEDGIYRTTLPTHVEEPFSQPDNTVVLYPNYPNPFNPTTTIKYDLPTASRVSLKVYDILGREVRNLVDGFRNAGSHEVTLNATDLSSGVYFYRLNAGDFVETKRLLLLR